jgi:response regulator NasT
MARDSRLKILLVDAVGARAAEFERILLEAGYRDIHHIAGGPGLAEDVGDLAPDLIIVDMAMPERDTLEGLRRTSARSPCPVVLCTDEDDPGFIEEAIAAGVSSYHVGSVSADAIRPIMTAAMALFRRYQQAELERKAALTSLEERRIVERAKAALMRQRGLAEPDAYRWLRNKAMKESRKLVSVAADILERTEGAE